MAGPAFRYFTLGGAFEESLGQFWPASSIKFAAVIGAFERLHAEGLSGATLLRFHDRWNMVASSGYELAQLSLVKSSNGDYDRLLLIAGLGRLHERTITAERGTPWMRLACAYGGQLLDAPPRLFVLGRGDPPPMIEPERPGLGVVGCSRSDHRTTVFELAHVLARFALHAELPEAERYRIGEPDRDFLEHVLQLTPSDIAGAARSVYGVDATVLRKRGWFSGAHRVEAAFVRAAKRTVAVAQVIPYAGNGAEPDLAQIAPMLATRALEALEALEKRGRRGAPFEPDRGELELRRTPDSLSVLVPEQARLEGWLDSQPLAGLADSSPPQAEAPAGATPATLGRDGSGGAGSGSGRWVRLPWPENAANSARPQVLTLRLRVGDQLIAHRAFVRAPEDASGQPVVVASGGRVR